MLPDSDDTRTTLEPMSQEARLVEPVNDEDGCDRAVVVHAYLFLPGQDLESAVKLGAQEPRCAGGS